MQPIISPWWFYLINTGENINSFCMVLLAFLGTGLFLSTIICLVEGRSNPLFKKGIKGWVIAALAFSFMGTMFIPNKATCYQMVAASVVTPDNLEAVGETATDIMDYIIDSVDKLIEDETAE